MNRKIIRVSKKRQITIPIQFYEHLGLKNEVECSLEDDAIVIRPIQKKPTTDFSIEILKDLINKGFSGDELIKQFEKQSINTKMALIKILEEADAIAAGEKKSTTFDEIFVSEDWLFFHSSF